MNFRQSVPFRSSLIKFKRIVFFGWNQKWSIWVDWKQFNLKMIFEATLWQRRRQPLMRSEINEMNLLLFSLWNNYLLSQTLLPKVEKITTVKSKTFAFSLNRWLRNGFIYVLYLFVVFIFSNAWSTLNFPKEHFFRCRRSKAWFWFSNHFLWNWPDAIWDRQ